MNQPCYSVHVDYTEKVVCDPLKEEVSGENTNMDFGRQRACAAFCAGPIELYEVLRYGFESLRSVRND